MDKEIFNISELAQLDEVISDLSNKIRHGVIYLHGDLGVGKTTFVQHWVHQYDPNLKVTSPTYSIINQYQLTDKTIIHSDLYRLSEAEELCYIGIDDWDPMTQLIFIEWPEKGEGYLPIADYDITLSLSLATRTLTIHSH